MARPPRIEYPGALLSARPTHGPFSPALHPWVRYAIGGPYILTRYFLLAMTTLGCGRRSR